MLWDVVYNFYVKYIFGGFYFDGGHSFRNALFSVYINNATYVDVNTKDVSFELFGQNISLGNYFSLIATIITMVVILVLCCMLIKKIYNICAHIIG